MADDLLDLFSDAISKMSQPSVAQSRYTHAPIMFGPNTDNDYKLTPGEGFTYATKDSQNSGLDYPDKASLLMRHPGISQMQMIQKLPQNKGSIYVDPGGSQDASTLKHEVTHNILDQGGMTDKDYQNVLNNLPSDVESQLRDSFYQTNRAGDAGSELPAYLNIRTPQSKADLPISDKLTQVYRDTMDKYLASHYPRAAKQYKAIRYPKDNK